MKHWGNATWTVFHGLACTLDATDYNARWLFSWFEEIIRVLPCGECRMHASRMFSSLRHPVRTIDDVRRALHQFHNAVNVRKGVSPFPFENYIWHHRQGNPIVKVIAFSREMTKSGRGRRDFVAGMTRNRVCLRFSREAIDRLRAHRVSRQANT